MILDAAWAPISSSLSSSSSSSSPGTTSPVFATAGRDKSVKIWGRDSEGGFICKATITTDAPVTAIDFCDEIYRVEIGEAITVQEVPLEISNNYYPSKAITQLAWKPSSKETSESSTKSMDLAIASEDSSLRIYSLC
ncbi:WD repeat domain-containing protein [Botrytis cinerea]